MINNKTSFVILIDTNAMAALSLYVEGCTTVEVALGTPDEGLKSKFKETKDTKDTQLYFAEREGGGISDGYRLFKYLKDKIEVYDTVQIWFSLLSQIELLHLFLERTFDIELTRKGIPYRIRRKNYFRTQIDFDFKSKISDYWEDQKKRLGEQDIEFKNPEKGNGAIQEIIKIAEIVTRYVALEPVDLYLYASGIYLRADEIYSRDLEFRSIINKICTDIEWRNIRDNIQDDLRKFIKSFEDEHQKEGRIRLPKGVTSLR